MTESSKLEESIKVVVKDGIGAMGFQDLQQTIINTYNEGGVQETLKVMTGSVTRKLSSIETNDIDPKLIRRVGMGLLYLVVLYYSVQLFLLLAPIIYPAYKTIQALQVMWQKIHRKTLMRKIIFRMRMMMLDFAGWDTGSSSASSTSLSTSSGSSRCTQRSRRDILPGVWLPSSTTEQIFPINWQSNHFLIIIFSLKMKNGKIDLLYTYDNWTKYEKTKSQISPTTLNLF